MHQANISPAAVVEKQAGILVVVRQLQREAFTPPPQHRKVMAELRQIFPQPRLTLGSEELEPQQIREENLLLQS
jgi:hypothetical protein